MIHCTHNRGMTLPTAVLLTCLVGLSACGLFIQAPTLPGDFYGRVVDDDTDAPIAGAVVAVIWQRYPYPAYTIDPRIHSVNEVLTDTAGRYRVTSQAPCNWNPRYAMKERPRVVVFKAGYGPFPWAHIAPRLTSANGQFFYQPLLEGATIRLRKGQGQLQSMSSLLLIGGDVDPARLPFLRAEIARQSPGDRQ